MRVGVLMPCRASLSQVKPAVQSVLDQSYPEFVLLIIDDASDSDVQSYLHSQSDRRVHVLRHETAQGVSHSLNRGLKELDTELVFRMDADDVARPDRLERQVKQFQKQPGLTVLGTDMTLLEPQSSDEAFESKLPTQHAAIAYRLCWSNAVNHPTVAYHRQAVLAAGGYDERLALGQDYDLWTRMILNHTFANLPRPLLSYRVHTGQNSRQLIHKRNQLHRQIQARYRRELTGLTVSPLFDAPADWTRQECPTQEDWRVWLRFLDRIQGVFLSGHIGRIQTRRYNPKHDLARRLYRGFNAAIRLGLPVPPEAKRMLKRLAPVYALSKGVF